MAPWPPCWQVAPELCRYCWSPFLANVLLTGLQGQSVGDSSAAIARDTDNAARHSSLECILTSEKCGVWSAVAHGHAKALCRSNHDVRAHFPGRFDQSECQEIRRHYGQCARFLCGFDFRLWISEFTVCSRILEKHSKGAMVRCQVGSWLDTNIDIKGPCSGAYDRNGLG